VGRGINEFNKDFRGNPVGRVGREEERFEMMLKL